ncbi:MAG: type II toxin-antitoxin system Phd/YefM family antitoxin [Chloroflexi bacterium]|nr:type II toxin-antitoxin system Phd/YefM family antitoxin [Chloroflexota bacterium]
MEKAVGAFEARRSFGKILQGVVSRGDRIVVERHGQPVAAVVPIQVYEQWKRRREAFFDQIEAAARRADLAADQADRLVDEAIQATRAQGGWPAAPREDT